VLYDIALYCLLLYFFLDHQPDIRCPNVIHMYQSIRKGRRRLSRLRRDNNRMFKLNIEKLVKAMVSLMEFTKENIVDDGLILNLALFLYSISHLFVCCMCVLHYDKSFV